jgi:hypothetical protein
VLLLGNAGAVLGQETPPSRPAPVLADEQLLRKYVVATLGPEGLIGAAAAAGYQQYQNYPDEWQRSAPGYMKRWASAYAAGAIGNTTKYAISHWMDQDPSFVRCTCTGFNARMKHAVFFIFRARTRDGREVFSPASLAGYTAEHMVPAALWFPRRHFWTEGVGLAAASIGSKVAINIFREFFGKPRDLLKHDD